MANPCESGGRQRNRGSPEHQAAQWWSGGTSWEDIDQVLCNDTEAVCKHAAAHGAAHGHLTLEAPQPSAPSVSPLLPGVIIAEHTGALPDAVSKTLQQILQPTTSFWPVMVKTFNPSHPLNT